MATGVGTQISLDDHALFMPSMTVKAMRDSRYRHPALAVAELIDNSIDARSRRVDVLIREHQVLVKQRHHWRVKQLAVFDNGTGDVSRHSDSSTAIWRTPTVGVRPPDR